MLTQTTHPWQLTSPRMPHGDPLSDALNRADATHQARAYLTLTASAARVAIADRWAWQTPDEPITPDDAPYGWRYA